MVAGFFVVLSIPGVVEVLTVHLDQNIPIHYIFSCTEQGLKALLQAVGSRGTPVKWQAANFLARPTSSGVFFRTGSSSRLAR